MEEPTETVTFKASPEVIAQLRAWTKVQIRISGPYPGSSHHELEARDVSFPANPLGITPEHRERGQRLALADALKAAGDKLLANIRTNLATWDAVPAGTEIWCRCCRRTHPIEAFR